MLDILERRLAKDIARNGGNEFSARISLIEELQNRRTRKTPGWVLREAVRMRLVYALWEPLIPRMAKIYREFGIEFAEAVLRPPGTTAPAFSHDNLADLERVAFETEGDPAITFEPANLVTRTETELWCLVGMLFRRGLYGHARVVAENAAERHSIAKLYRQELRDGAQS
jgi:hypothetical protein